MTDPLRETLIDLVLRLKPDDIELIIGGGYGLLLRSELIAQRSHTSRFGLNTIARSTSDLDCFLGVEVISDSNKTRRIAEALESMGFTPLQRNWVFSKPIGAHDNLHIDLLAQEVPDSLAAKMHGTTDPRRIRPIGFDGLHGRRTPEAVTIHQHTTRLDVSRDGRGAHVRIPHPISFVLMKLFAFRDKINDSRKDHGAYHAFDIMQTIDSMNGVEWDEARELLNDTDASQVVAEAREIVSQLFATAFAEGATRTVEYARDRQGVPVTAAQAALFVDDLRALFST